VKFYSFFDHLEIFSHLLFDHVINCEHIVELFRKNEDPDSAVGHASSHYSARVRKGYTVKLPVTIHQSDGTDRGQILVEVYLLYQLLFQPFS
jgi:hypothetical protein